MVPTPLRSLLTIHVDPALHSLRTVQIARITVQQVFQNLIQNTAKAMRESGRTHGNLHVSGGILPASDGERLELWFRDDGAGVSPEQLPRIFERGFSTKSRESNSGIGLHGARMPSMRSAARCAPRAPARARRQLPGHRPAT